MGHQNRIRILTAAALFDGHDAAINIMRRILQSKGAEVIHLGHNRSALEIAMAAIQEDVQAIAITSYQGGHLEFFKYLHDILAESGAGHILIFGGGGGTILPEEIQALQDYGITRLYSPEDGMRMGLSGMIEDVLERCRTTIFPRPETTLETGSLSQAASWIALARAISHAENQETSEIPVAKSASSIKKVPVIGVTGPGGAGKSSLLDELIRMQCSAFEDLKVGIISIDPTLKKSGGALLGDRIRFNTGSYPQLYFRSLATRDSGEALYRRIHKVIEVCKMANLDLIYVETPGIGQSDCGLVDITDIQLYVMTPEYGAPSQLEKINMLDYADLIAVNKCDRMGALDAIADVKRQYRRNHQLWNIDDSELPVVGTNASRFNDPGVKSLVCRLKGIVRKAGFHTFPDTPKEAKESSYPYVHGIPNERVHYLAEIAKTLEDRKTKSVSQIELARQRQSLVRLLSWNDLSGIAELKAKMEELDKELEPSSKQLIEQFYVLRKLYQSDGRKGGSKKDSTEAPLHYETLSGIQLPRISIPRLTDEGDILAWMLNENFPGQFPFTSGVYPFKNDMEDPTRMFAGEGTPERSNQRFHYLSQNLKSKRLSTAFDSVTLYGENPNPRPDIYGKIGNSGVSIATLDDIKKLYAGFDLTDSLTSVSMTINGPAPVMLAFFLNAAIDQACETYIIKNGLLDKVLAYKREKFEGKQEPVYQGSDHIPETGLLMLGITGDEILDPEIYDKLKEETLRRVRGTVQADILKEDQAQNTCIFSIDFALHLMGDIQSYFSCHNIDKFYSVSISGYHIAEAGANPITQLAFTLANGFTYIEYFLSRGLAVNDFASNLSFFFSNGLDPEYAVIGRVARRIWAKALKWVYGANERSQKLKYHIQTSGRSLHAQEMEFNDIRTTLQALYAIYDNCNSLHTNAFDEALTTPTEQSVRRALAIQLIIQREFGFTKTDNPMQGSYLISELTDLVEEAVWAEFKRISDRGGVLGAMERMYQRNKIQEESLLYESKKSDGSLPLVGVNMFLPKDKTPESSLLRVSRSTDEEKRRQIDNLRAFEKLHADQSGLWLDKLKWGIQHGENSFGLLMDASKYCSLGQLTELFYSIGGRYRRSM